MSRNLSNLYISESFQYLVQISGSEFETSLGSAIPSINITASNAVTASYSNASTSASYAAVATSSSYAINASNAVSASYAVTASYALNAGATVSTASLLTTASAVANVITFTKGDGSTFNVTVSQSGSVASASYADYAATAGTANTASYVGNAVYTASVVDATTTYTKGNGTTFNTTINNVTSSISSSRAVSSSFATLAATATSASQAANATSASYAISASQAQNAVSASYYGGSVVSASYAATSSYATNFNVAGTLTALSASITYLTTVFETSSVIYSSGSNQFGDAANDTQTLYGTVNILTGPLNVSGSSTFHNGITGSLAGTASFATSASQAVSASYAFNATSASFAVSSSRAVSASFATSASQAVSSSFATTASFALNVTPTNTGSLLVTASAVNNVITFTKGDASTFDVTVNTGSASAFPYTGSAEISGSLTVINRIIVGNNLTDGPVNNGILAGFGNTVYGPTNGTFLLAGGGQINSGVDYAAMVGGYGHRVNYAYSQVFGGTYNYLGYNSPGSSGDVYAAGIFGGNENTINGWRSNNQTIVGGSNNEIYTYNAVSDFNNNALILGGRFNKISGSDNLNSTIVGGKNHFIGTGVSGSVIVGGNAITASQSDTLYTSNIIITGSNTLATGSNVIGNWTDNYSGSAKVHQVVTLTQTEYNAIGSPDANTLYIISGSAANATLGANTFVGNQVVSGSLRGNVSAITLSSNTASLDLSTTNFFTFTLNDGAVNYINPSNIQPGQTINVKITNGSAGTGTVAFPSSVKQVSGSLYVPTASPNAVDIVTFISYDSTNLYLSNVKNFI